MIQNIQAPIIYPESDGKPLSDNTKQFELITVIQGNIDSLVPDFVAGNLSWFPVEKQTNLNVAPDVMVVFGRPKGHRRSYRQWEEGNIPPQVTFEIASPSNTRQELEEKKLEFYNTYGVEEYYLYDPEKLHLMGWIRRGGELQPIVSMLGWVSPRLGIRFEMIDNDLKLFKPNGEAFATYRELTERARRAEALVVIERQRVEVERQRAETERQKAETERQRAQEAEAKATESEQLKQFEQQRADSERQRAREAEAKARESEQQKQFEHQRADSEQQRADSEQQRADSEQQRAREAEAKVAQLEAKLAQLGIDPNQL